MAPNDIVPISSQEGIQVTAKTIRDTEKLRDIRHRVNRRVTWNGFSGDESSDGDPD